MIDILKSFIEKPSRVAVGLMSGTSLDGIDAAVVRITGSGTSSVVELLGFSTLPFEPQERRALLNLCSRETGKVDDICAMNVYLGKKFAEAATLAAQGAGLSLQEVDFISSHGQTIHHMPDRQATLQIGELAVIAARTGCLTVGDFRPSDMAAGGQGAPLVPLVDYLLFGSPERGRALLNIGGIANVTVLPAQAREGDVVGFDTGPGNVLIDEVVSLGTAGKEHMDRDGHIARQGVVCRELLDSWLNTDPFVWHTPPKSTGREQYTAEYAAELFVRGQGQGLSFPDLVATVTAYTSESIAINFREFVDPLCAVSEVYVGGGGVNNPVLMENLSVGLQRRVLPMESLGISSDAKEAVAFAVLGNEFLLGRTNNLPTATGAKRAVRMGKLVLP
jgi:anhydro-N-acetylmuramic acid kinase